MRAKQVSAAHAASNPVSSLAMDNESNAEEEEDDGLCAGREVEDDAEAAPAQPTHAAPVQTQHTAHPHTHTIFWISTSTLLHTLHHRHSAIPRRSTAHTLSDEIHTHAHTTVQIFVLILSILTFFYKL